MKIYRGIPGMAPITSSSNVGWVAAVIAMVSPSQPRPAVIQRTSISLDAPNSSLAPIAVGHRCRLDKRFKRQVWLGRQSLSGSKEEKKKYAN